MKYVYILRSIPVPDRHYTGLTDDVMLRLAQHNSGACSHTRKFGPWKLLTVVGFDEAEKAVAFERYLKSG